MGLFKTAARAAVATRVVGSVSRRQNQRWAAQDALQAQAQPPAAPVPAAPAPAVPPPPAAPRVDTGAMIEQLTQLGQLRDAGVLTEAEFEVQKHRILTGS